MICEECKKEIPFAKGLTRVWYCKDCELTYVMIYGKMKGLTNEMILDNEESKLFQSGLGER